MKNGTSVLYFHVFTKIGKKFGKMNALSYDHL